MNFEKDKKTLNNIENIISKLLSSNEYMMKTGRKKLGFVFQLPGW